MISGNSHYCVTEALGSEEKITRRTCNKICFQMSKLVKQCSFKYIYKASICCMIAPWQEQQKPTHTLTESCFFFREYFLKIFFHRAALTVKFVIKGLWWQNASFSFFQWWEEDVLLQLPLSPLHARGALNGLGSDERLLYMHIETSWNIETQPSFVTTFVTLNVSFNFHYIAPPPLFLFD